MFFWLAEANTSAGAPALICVARAELAAKLKVTFVPGWAASNCLPSSPKDSVSDAAANTVMLPDTDGEAVVAGLVVGPEADPLSSLPPQPARPTTTAAVAASTLSIRDISTPWSGRADPERSHTPTVGADAAPLHPSSCICATIETKSPHRLRADPHSLPPLGLDQPHDRIGRMEPGPHNAITDVPGVLV